MNLLLKCLTKHFRGRKRRRRAHRRRLPHQANVSITSNCSLILKTANHSEQSQRNSTTQPTCIFQTHRRLAATTWALTMELTLSLILSMTTNLPPSRTWSNALIRSWRITTKKSQLCATSPSQTWRRKVCGRTSTSPSWKKKSKPSRRWKSFTRMLLCCGLASWIDSISEKRKNEQPRSFTSRCRRNLSWMRGLGRSNFSQSKIWQSLRLRKGKH